jgi:hypothetical protein
VPLADIDSRAVWLSGFCFAVGHTLENEKTAQINDFR